MKLSEKIIEIENICLEQGMPATSTMWGDIAKQVQELERRVEYAETRYAGFVYILMVHLLTRKNERYY